MDNSTDNNKNLKQSFTKTPISTPKPPQPVAAVQKPTLEQEPPRPAVAAVPAVKPMVFFQATAKGSTAIRSDGTKERLPGIHQNITQPTVSRPTPVQPTPVQPAVSNQSPSTPRPAQPAARPSTRPAYPNRNSRPDSRSAAPRRPWQKRTPTLGRGENGPKPKNTYNKYMPDGTPKLRIIPVGGLEEIGKNMTIFEYDKDIIVVDMGLSFPDTDMLGIDYVIPDATYLEEHKENIRGLIITHGHLDHIGAVPYLIEKVGFPNTYGSDVTIGLIKMRLEEFGIPDGGRLQVVSPDGDSIQLGVFKINFFRLNHSIPGAMGLEIETPYGILVYTTDWKFDYTPADGKPASFQHIAALGGKGIKVLFSDSTNVEKEGHTISEAVVERALIQVIEEAEGRIVIAMFSTLINRMQQVINAANKNGRKVLVVGMSMQKALEMAVGIKAVTIPPQVLISDRQAKNIADNKLVILSTGAQGEDRAALARMAKGEHRTIKIRKGDTVVISASPIPGNERSVSNVMDMIYRAGGHVIYNKDLDVHTSGHASKEDLKLMIALVKPEYFIPLHGERHKLILHARLAQQLGIEQQKCIVGSDGQIMEILPDGRIQITDEYIPHGFVMVDGLGVGDVGNIVIRDRQAMAQNGMFVASAIVDRANGKLKTSPDIISRGFIYMRENEELVNDARNLVRKIVTDAYGVGKKPDMTDVKEKMRRDLIKYLYDRTEREPLVIAVLKEV